MVISFLGDEKSRQIIPYFLLFVNQTAGKAKLFCSHFPTFGTKMLQKPS